MTLKQAVIAFLAAHDQYETYAKFKISYGTLKDKDMHDAEHMAVGVLRDLVQMKRRKPQGSRSPEGE